MSLPFHPDSDAPVNSARIDDVPFNKHWLCCAPITAYVKLSYLCSDRFPKAPNSVSLSSLLVPGPFCQNLRVRLLLVLAKDQVL